MIKLITPCHGKGVCPFFRTPESVLNALEVPHDFKNLMMAIEIVKSWRRVSGCPFKVLESGKGDGEAFRQHLLETLDDHLSRLPVAPAAVLGKPFYFLRGHLVAVPLEIVAWDLRSLRKALAQVDDSSLYYHAVEAIGRLGNPRGDFAAWVEDVLRLPSLARRIAEIDPFVMSLAGVRARLLEIVDSELALGPSA